MRITFHGPLDRVTGSCYELYDPAIDVHFLVDCGMRQGERGAAEYNAGRLPFEAAELDFVVLTHAHADHCGLIPRLYREGFTGSVYCTRETAELAQLVLTDSARYPEAAFTEADVKRINWREHNRALFGHHLPVHRNVFLQYFRNAHILGSVAVRVSWGEPYREQGSITFSGDVGPNTEANEAQLLMRSRMSPQVSQYAVLESTYGGVQRDPAHQDAMARLERLGAALDAGLARGGVVLLPCFAVGRTQDVLLDLHILHAQNPERFKGVPVYFDAPMAARVNGVYARGLARMFTAPKSKKTRPAWLSRSLFAVFGLDRHSADDRALLVDCITEMLVPTHRPAVARREALKHWRRLHSVDPSARAQLSKRAIVVTGGGMADGGPVQVFLKRLLPSPKTTVLFAGYCAGGTVGGQLLALREVPLSERTALTDTLVLGDVPMPVRRVRAQVAYLSGYSAHADGPSLLDWMFMAGPPQARAPMASTVFLTHGTAQRRRALAQAIHGHALERGVQVEVALPTGARSCYDLTEGRWVSAGVSELELMRAEMDEQQQELAALRAQLATSGYRSVPVLALPV